MSTIRRVLHQTPRSKTEMVFQPDGTFDVERHENVAPLLEHNKYAQKNPELNRAGHVHKIAEIPGGLYHLWKTILGDPNTGDPEVIRRWNQKLNDPDWRHVRTDARKL